MFFLAPPPVFCAIDTVDLSRACVLAAAVTGVVAGLKIGLEFFHAHGAGGVQTVRQAGDALPVFLDLKFHDIPTTVAGAVRGVMPLRPFMLTVHASGGQAMLRVAAAACAEEATKAGLPRPLLVAVTVLTSLDDAVLAETGVTSTAADQVVRLADLAQACGLDGVVCSAHEVKRLRAYCGSDFRLVVPGVRPTWAASDDQKRILTPAEALAAGADILVIGRPITTALDPAAAARRIAREIAEAPP
ncbi:MAG: orotidine-5'-phosphate decarboxylase [Rhodospirillaceae bacterium]|nr:MAG: orotidine-5'-phosphate decarboxylase [Rhodospirillaceae bacterium]